MGLLEEIAVLAIRGVDFSPTIRTSKRFKHWISRDDLRRCVPCAQLHGKIWLQHEKEQPEAPLHFACRCIVEAMQAIVAGTATVHGIDGADYHLKTTGCLPDRYITSENLKSLGWEPQKKPSSYVSGKILTKGIYKNVNGHLPQKVGRIWYEADINYIEGKRNAQRIVWSNDGLIFVTYDHYQTFYEIV